MGVYKYIVFVICLIGCVFFSSCNGSHYVAQDFYFPKDSDPDKSNWKYRGYVHMSLDGNWFDLNKKNVRITLFNDQGRKISIAAFDVTSYGLEVDTSWENDLLTINFIETKNLINDDVYKPNSDRHSRVSIKTIICNPRKLFDEQDR